MFHTTCVEQVSSSIQLCMQVGTRIYYYRAGRVVFVLVCPCHDFLTASSVGHASHSPLYLSLSSRRIERIENIMFAQLNKRHARHRGWDEQALNKVARRGKVLRFPSKAGLQ